MTTTLVIIWSVAVVLVALGLMPLAMALRFRAYVRRERARTRAPFTPKLSVVLPCKGIDPGFEANVRALLRQEYPDYELLVVVATRDDPAYECVEKLVAAEGMRHVRLLVAGIEPGRSQKLNNQLCALRHVRAATEAYVFVDSDIRAHPQFLRELAAPLLDAGVGATTGFRWYIPERRWEGGALHRLSLRFGSYLRATWNGGGLPMLIDPRHAYAWGGAMATLRRTFEECEVAARWEKALTDDFPLTNAVRARGLTVRFVPACLVGSHEDSTLAQTWEWTDRQTIICRVYDRGLWRLIFTVYALHAVSMAVGVEVLLLALWLSHLGALLLWPMLVALAVLPLEYAAGMLLWTEVRRLLPEVGGRRQMIKHVLLIPAALTLIFLNSVHSLRTNEIRWRGTRYRLHSAVETEVIPENAPCRHGV